MPAFLANWQFDPLSFGLGLGLALLLGLLLYSQRATLGQLGERLGDAREQLRLQLTSGSDARYRRALGDALQQMHMAGSILALDEILVEPRFLLEEPPYRPGEDYDPDITVAVPATPDLPYLSAVYQAPARNLADLAAATHDVVLMGAPGSGKSTTLQALALAAASEDDRRFAKAVLPIYIHLDDIAFGDNKTDRAEQLAAAAAHLCGLQANSLRGLFGRLLAAGKALVLIDGLDELPVAKQAAAIDWVLHTRDALPNNRYVLASPPTRYAKLIDVGFATLFMGGWSVDNARQLVQRWVAAWPQVLTQQRRRRRAQDDIDPALVAGWLAGGSVGRTPFEITLKTWTGLAGDAEGPHPVNWLNTYVNRLRLANEARPALINAALKMQRDGLTGLTRESLRTMVRTAARDLPAKEQSSYDPLDLVDELATKPGGLLVRRADGSVGFRHPLVRAFLVAVHMAAEGDTAEATLAGHIGNEDWATVMPYFVSLYEGARLVAEVLKQKPDLLHNYLFQVARWLGDAKPKARWRGEALRRLATIMLTPNAPIELRGRALVALVGTQDDNVARLFQQAVEAPDPLARQLGALGLGALGDVRAIKQIKPLLEDDDLLVRWSAVLSLALIGSTPAIETLGAALLDSDLRMTVAIGQALALNAAEGHALLHEALGFGDAVVRRAAVAGLARISHKPEALDAIRNLLNNEQDFIVRDAAELVVKRIDDGLANPPVPMRPADETPWLLKWYASQGKTVPAGPAGRNALYEALQADDEQIQVAAADHFGRLGVLHAIEPLKQVTKEAYGNTDLVEMSYRAMAAIARATGEYIRL